MAVRLCMLLCISAFGVYGEKKVEETFMKKTTKDLDTSASGYIYQQHGNNPAQVIYLNKGDVLDHLNEGEVLGHLNQGEVLGQLNQGEVLPHLHLKQSHAGLAGHASLPYVYQSQGVGPVFGQSHGNAGQVIHPTVANPGRSTSQAYYVTHYQDYGDGGKKYNVNHPPHSHYSSSMGVGNRGIGKVSSICR